MAGSTGREARSGLERLLRSARLASVAAATAATAALVLTPTPALAASAPRGSFPGAVKATVGPLIAGTSSYVHGTFAWTGYPYNDTTAYPSGVADNSANLIQLQIGLTHAGAVRIRAILETLTDPKVPLLSVGFDTDRNTATGAATLPGWKADGPLGLDDLVSISAAGTTLDRWNGSGWSAVGEYPAHIDSTSNSMTAVIPRRALDPRGHVWDAVGALGLAGANSWLEGKGSIYSLAFVHAESCLNPAIASCNPKAIAAGTGWQDGEQKLVLSGAAPSTAGVASIDFAKIADRTNALASADRPGFHTLLYYSHLNLGEGLQPSSCIADVVPCSIYAGPYQPYVVDVPAGIRRPMPVIFMLHGVDANDLQASFPSSRSFPGVFVAPFGRGTEVGWGGGDATDGTPTESGAYGQEDVLAVYADVMRRLPLDPNRVVMSGVSMGGLGAFHIAEFYPDLFTGMFSEVGGDCCIASTNHAQPRRLENLIDLPVRMVNGTLDPLANAGDALTDFYPALDSLHDVDYRSYELLRRSHDIGVTEPHTPDVLGNFLSLEQCLLTQLVSRRRVLNPARVVYIIDPNFEFTDRATGLNAVETHAYWVSGLRPRDSGEARIDVTTLARSVHTYDWSTVDGVGQNITTSGDLCGANPAEHSDDAWTIHGIKVTPETSQTVSNGFAMTITQMGSATLDLTRMGITPNRPISAYIAGDGETALTLEGPWRDGERVTVTRDGAADGTVIAHDGRVVLTRDFSLRQVSTPAGGTVDVSGVELPAYLDTPAGDVSVDQEPEGRVLAGHHYVLTP